jgi:hypothetical protein
VLRVRSVAPRCGRRALAALRDGARRGLIGAGSFRARVE